MTNLAEKKQWPPHVHDYYSMPYRVRLRFSIKESQQEHLHEMLSKPNNAPKHSTSFYLEAK